MECSAAASLCTKQTSKPLKPGHAIREDAIVEGSKLKYVGPGQVEFDGVRFKAVRDLGHVSEADLRDIAKSGKNFKDSHGVRLDGHHYKQQYHREDGAFIVEIPKTQHCISNRIQHPLGNSGGLTREQRTDWDKLRNAFNKERAKTELLRRGLDLD